MMSLELVLDADSISMTSQKYPRYFLRVSWIRFLSDYVLKILAPVSYSAEVASGGPANETCNHCYSRDWLSPIHCLLMQLTSLIL